MDIPLDHVSILKILFGVDLPWGYNFGETKKNPNIPHMAQNGKIIIHM